MDTQIKVRGYHTDLYQHVNNARYLEFLEEARWQLFEDHMDLESFMRGGYLFFVININISYRNPARVGDTVTVRSGLKKIGNKSAVIRQQIINKATGTVCVDADVTFVIADTGGRPLKLEADLKERVVQIPLFDE